MLDSHLKPLAPGFVHQPVLQGKVLLPKRGQLRFGGLCSLQLAPDRAHARAGQTAGTVLSEAVTEAEPSRSNSLPGIGAVYGQVAAGRTRALRSKALRALQYIPHLAKKKKELPGVARRGGV